MSTQEMVFNIRDRIETLLYFGDLLHGMPTNFQLITRPKRKNKYFGSSNLVELNLQT